MMELVPDNIANQILEDLRCQEGYRSRPYKDTTGNLTIGYGTKIEEITRTEASLLLEHRVESHWLELTEKKPIVLKLNGHAQRALANMAYQLGVPGLLTFKRMWAALEETTFSWPSPDYEKAAREARDSLWYRQTPGRAHMVSLWLEGDDDDDAALEHVSINEGMV